VALKKEDPYFAERAPSMAKKIKRKELVKGTDEFLSFSSRAFNLFNAHRTAFNYAGYAVALIVAVYLGANTYMRYVNRNGQEAYNLAYDTLSKNMKPDAAPEELKKSEELFDKVIHEYGRSKAARLALPQVAYLKFADKKYDEAIDLYMRFSKKLSSEGSLWSLTHLALAACYEAKGDLKKAIGFLNSILDRAEDPFRETAMYSLARLYRLDGQPEKAEETLKKFVEEYKTSPFVARAKAGL
jgi:tetratricopeptide (TPR) repeat protein